MSPKPKPCITCLLNPSLIPQMTQFLFGLMEDLDVRRSLDSSKSTVHGLLTITPQRSLKTHIHGIRRPMSFISNLQQALDFRSTKKSPNTYLVTPANLLMPSKPLKTFTKNLRNLFQISSSFQERATPAFMFHI